MFVKEIKYTDYNGIDRNEKFYFNLNISFSRSLFLRLMDRSLMMVRDSSSLMS